MRQIGKVFICIAIFISLVNMASFTQAFEIGTAPDFCAFQEILGLASINEVQRVAIVYPDGKSADLSQEDITRLLQGDYWDKSMHRVVEPYEISDKLYYNIYYADEKITMLAGSVLCGTYGEGNYLFYRLVPSNTNNALWYTHEELYEKYLLLAGASNEAPALADCLNVPEHDWAVSEIQEAASKNILPYELTNDYGGNITREDFCLLAVQLISEIYNPGISSRDIMFYDSLKEFRFEITGTYDYCNAEFKDYENPSGAVNNLVMLGVIGGRDDGTFDPDGSISRQEAAKILCNIASLFLDLSASDISFADNDIIADWAKGKVAWVSQNDIMIGTGDNRFDPRGTYTVEQSIATINRLYNIIGKTYKK